MKTKFLSILTVSILIGLVSCNKDAGTVSYTYNKATAKYLNLEEVRNQSLVSESRGISNPSKVFYGESVLLIGEKDKGIHVFDNTNSSNPVNLSFLNLPYTSEFYVKDGYIYAEGHYDFVKIDINDIHNPVLVDREENVFGTPSLNDKGEALIGFDYKVVTESFKLGSKEAKELSNTHTLYYDYMNNLIPESSVPSSFAGTDNGSKGTLNKIAVHNNFIYVIGGYNLYTLSDNSSDIQFIGSEFVTSNMETIYPEGNFLYIGTSTSMVIMSTSTPSNPSYMSTYWHPNSCDPVYPNGDVAYLTLRTSDNDGCAGDVNSLVVIDITNKQNPQSVDEIQMFSPYGMALIDNKLFVGEGNNGIRIFDASDADNLVELSSNNSVKAFDVIGHPSNPNIIMTTGVNGLEQYQYNSTTHQLDLLSSVNY